MHNTLKKIKHIYNKLFCLPALVYGQKCPVEWPGFRHLGVHLGVTRSPAGDLSLSSMVLHPLGEQSCCALIRWLSVQKQMDGSPSRLIEVEDQVWVLGKPRCAVVSQLSELGRGPPLRLAPR